MSDVAVEASLRAMEAWLEGRGGTMDDQVLADWNRSFQEAVARAERGPGWSDLVAWAHDLAKRVDERKRALEVDRDVIKAELNQQSVGDRALKSYGSSTR